MLWCVFSRVPLLQNTHWHVTVCIRECTASSSSCVSCMTTRGHTIFAFHIVLFGVVTVFRLCFFCRPLIHLFNYFVLLSYCLVPVELEGSIGFVCDHDHAPCTENSSCSLLLQILFNVLSQIVLRWYFLNPSCFFVTIFPQGAKCGLNRMVLCPIVCCCLLVIRRNSVSALQ